MQWSLEELGMTMLVLLVGWFGCTAIQEIWMQEIAEVYGNGFLQIAGGIGALLLFFHAVDGQGMIGMVLRYYMTGICGS